MVASHSLRHLCMASEMNSMHSQDAVRCMTDVVVISDPSDPAVACAHALINSTSSAQEVVAQNQCQKKLNICCLVKELILSFMWWGQNHSLKTDLIN